MTQELILQNITRHISLSPEETALFLSLLEEKMIPKRSLILKEKQPCNTIQFVCSGTLRAYYIDQENRESTVMFAIRDWWITDMYCFLNRLPAMLCIEAVEPTVVLSLQIDDLNRLYREVPKFERFFRIIMQNAYTREQLRMIENFSLSAQERYTRFLRKYPQIAKQVPQKQIASYLGITPVFLSMIRARMAGK